MENLSFENARSEDCRMFYEWRNDEVVRLNSFDDGEIDYNDHEKWFFSKMEDEDTVLYVLKENGDPAGQIRFDLDKNTAVISISIAKEFRGRSLGKRFIEMLSDHVLKEKIAEKIVAYIKQENVASLNAFQAAGYSLKEGECEIKGKKAYCMICRKDKKKMKLVVIPPDIADISPLKALRDIDGVSVFSMDKYLQKNAITDIFGEKISVIGPEDLGGDSLFSDVNDKAKYFARNWFDIHKGNDVLNFQGVNVASQLVIAFTFYFIKVLKAIDIATAIIGDKRFDDIVLADDRNTWSGIFKEVAEKKKTDIEVYSVDNTEDKNEVDQRQLAERTSFIKHMAGLLKRIKPAPVRVGGILYSCALRFAEPLWKDIEPDRCIYYVRPEYSFKAHKKALASKCRINHIIPEDILTHRDEKICLDWRKGRDVRHVLSNFFYDGNFFIYKGLVLWEIVKADLFYMVESSILEGARRILFFNRFFEEFSPTLIVVEEDTCPFNRLLVDCAAIKDIPTLQLQHGLLTNDVMSGAIGSSVVAVQGEYAREKLLEWGIDEKKIKVTGAPHYQKRIMPVNREEVRKKWLNKFNVPQNKKIISLITSPFFSERHPYFVGNPLSPENTVKMIDIAQGIVRSENNAYILIKIHPIDDNSWLIENKIKELGLAEHVTVLRECDTVDMIVSSDLVLCGGSTVYLEALLLEVPVLIFDDYRKSFWQALKSEYLDLGNKDMCVRSVQEILGSEEKKRIRLNKQNEELSWHFIDKNKNAAQRFEQVMKDMSKLKGENIKEVK